MKKKFNISKKLYLLAFMLVSSSPAMATTSNMPWVSMFDKFVGVLTGPLGRLAVIAAIAIAGYFYMFGNFEGANRKLVGVILGATLIFGAISWAPQWFGYSGAVLI
jgi:trbC/VIRB2 family